MLFRSSSKACGHQFVVYADNRAIAEDQRTLVERLLLEKISLHGICRAVGVSIRWLMDFMITRFKAFPDHLHVQPVTSPRDVLMGRLDMEADERPGRCQDSSTDPSVPPSAGSTACSPAAAPECISRVWRPVGEQRTRGAHACSAYALKPRTAVDLATRPQRGSHVITSSNGPTRDQRYP
jgi:hypothetical protein